VTTRRVLQSLAAVVAVAVLAFTQAKVSQAAFHLIQIREVYPGSAANPNSEYVVLQTWAPGQNFVSGHSVRTFGPTGVPTGTTTFTSGVANGENQATILLATAEAGAQFGIAPDLQIPAAGLDPSGGAVCWEEGLDCVSWGNFTGNLPSAAGTPAPAIPDGSALRRSIARGCSNVLEPLDDTNNSSADFAAATPAPSNNAAPTGKIPCDNLVVDPPPIRTPKTFLRKGPGKRTKDRTPRFTFRSDEMGATFQCRVDKKAYRSCRSPYTTKRLAPGKHRFSVRAKVAGEIDRTPATYSFTVLR
jgi:hypothetical protein